MINKCAKFHGDSLSGKKVKAGHLADILVIFGQALIFLFESSLNLEVSAQANEADLLGDRDDRRVPLTPIDDGEDAVFLEAIELRCNLVLKCVGQWPGLEKPRFGSIDEM